MSGEAKMKLIIWNSNTGRPEVGLDGKQLIECEKGEEVVIYNKIDCYHTKWNGIAQEA